MAVSIAGCGKHSREQPAPAKTWSLLATQPKRLITQNVNIGLSTLAPKQGPNLVKDLGQTFPEDRPSLEPVPSDRRISAPTVSTDEATTNSGFEPPSKFLSELRNNPTPRGAPSFVAPAPALAPVEVAVLPSSGSEPSSSFGAFIARPTSSGSGSSSPIGGGGFGGTASTSAAAPITSPSNRIPPAPIFSSAPSSNVPPPALPAIGGGTGIAVVSNPPPAGETAGNDVPPNSGGENPTGDGQGASGENAKPNPGAEEPPPAQPGTGDQGEGELRSTSFAIVASNTAGTVSSLPEQYTLGNEMIIPTMILMFNDDNEDVQKWTYALDPGQENFPAAATIKEGFFSKYEGLLCAPDPKGCQGRFLRWFDLGVVPNVGQDPRGYLAAFHLGKLKREQINTVISYVDVPIGAGNQIKMPPIAAKVGHVYTVVLAPAAVPMALNTRINSPVVLLGGTSIAVGVMPIEMNLDDPIQYELLKSYTMSTEYKFARGILARGVGPTLYHIDSNPAVLKYVPTVVPLPGVQTIDPNSLIINRTTPTFQGDSK